MGAKKSQLCHQQNIQIIFSFVDEMFDFLIKFNQQQQSSPQPPDSANLIPKY